MNNIKKIYALVLVCVTVVLFANCQKKYNCSCMSGGSYEIIDTARYEAMGFPVPNTPFDTTITTDCFTLNLSDTEGVYYPTHGVIMYPFVTCHEK